MSRCGRSTYFHSQPEVQTATMSAKPSNSSNRQRKRNDGAKELTAEAKRHADAYQIVLRSEDDIWYGSGLELPLVFAHGLSPEACVANTRAALTAAVVYLLENGRRPPVAATLGRRTQQINIRLTAAEKLLLEATAKRKGFSGLSDFLRAATIEAATK